MTKIVYKILCENNDGKVFDWPIYYSPKEAVPQALETVGEPSPVPAVEAGPYTFAVIFVIFVNGICIAPDGNSESGEEIIRILHRPSKDKTSSFFHNLPHGF